jgi:metal-responsive CopG/Arc/MetJ family transcriptional regulator
MPNGRAISLRLPEKLAAELTAVARTEEVPISEAIRTAISGHIASRRTDPAFQARLRERIEKDREVIERLSM